MNRKTFDNKFCNHNFNLILGYLKKLERATCMPDPCYAETLYKRRNKIIAKDAILAPWENGKCYELDTRGPCPEFFTFKVLFFISEVKAYLKNG